MTKAKWSLLGVYLLSFLFFALYQFQSSYIPGVDGYYHIRYAQLLAGGHFFRDFPWATMGLWSTHFSDKEFLFHIFLIPFSYFDNLEIGAKWATVTLAAGSVSTFYHILTRHKVSAPFFWYLLLMSSGGYFLYRNNVPRPQVLSIILCQWSVHFLLQRSYKKLFLLCFFYPWAYTGYILPGIFAIILVINHRIIAKSWELTPLKVTFCATALGMIIHPYFPRNLIFFYVQNIFVLLVSWTKAPVAKTMGAEFKPMSTRNLITVITSALIPWLSVFFHQINFPKRQSEKITGLFLISLATILLSGLTKRFAEYAIPLSLFFCALYFTPQLKNWRQFSNPLKGLFIIFTAILLFRSHKDIARLYIRKPAKLQKAAAYLRKHAKLGDTIFHCDWDDSAQLFHFNPHNRYLLFLDPNFLYALDPKKWQIWHDFANGKSFIDLKDIYDQHFGQQFGICTKNFRQLKNHLRASRYFDVVYEDKYAYIFKRL